MKMPMLFIGHGSPMNAIEKNEFTMAWEQVVDSIPRPRGILSISAHWFTDGTKVQRIENPRAVNDMYGFPKELYEVNYSPKGDLYLSDRLIRLIEIPTEIDNTWGIDHGTWTVLNVMYPDCDIPVVQLSIDRNAKPRTHYEIGQMIKYLRGQNYLILGTGNYVHNLMKADMNMKGGYDWATEFNEKIKNMVINKDIDGIMKYKNLGKSADLSTPTTEHYDPLLYIMGALDGYDNIKVFNDKVIYGSLNMTSFLIY